ncbi:hypothetical protein GCM10027160_32750 [Streptomyces calidiresistens]
MLSPSPEEPPEEPPAPAQPVTRRPPVTVRAIIRRARPAPVRRVLVLLMVGLRFGGSCGWWCDAVPAADRDRDESVRRHRDREDGEAGSTRPYGVLCGDAGATTPCGRGGTPGGRGAGAPVGQTRSTCGPRSE